MLDQSQQELIAAAGAADTGDALRSALRWDEAGWDWQYYGPLLDMLFELEIPLRAGNIDQDAMRQVYAGDVDEAVEGVLDEAALQALAEDIDASHCGMLPPSQFPAMVRVQQARDLQLARSLLEGSKAPDGLRVLIAGNYHIRRDVGVPRYLQFLGIDSRSILSLAFLEVDPQLLDPQDYLEGSDAEKAFDYIWFTPVVSLEDYCASLLR